MNALKRSTSTRVGSGSAGFTLVELMIAMVTASIVMLALFRFLVASGRSYTDQREVIDARESARSAAALLISDLRSLSAAGGDLYSIGAQSLTIRSTVGRGLVCNKHPTLARFAMRRIRGRAQANDSVLVFASRGVGTGDDSWKVVKLVSVWDPNGGGVPQCAGDTLNLRAESVWQLAGDTAGIKPGGPARVFQRVEYGLYTDGAGVTWLGRKVNGAASWEKLTGPLQSGSNGGLALQYYDVNGNVTAVPAQVATIEIVIRARSTRASRRGTVVAPRIDSVRTRVLLRG